VERREVDRSPVRLNAEASRGFRSPGLLSRRGFLRLIRMESASLGPAPRRKWPRNRNPRGIMVNAIAGSVPAHECRPIRRFSTCRRVFGARLFCPSPKLQAVPRPPDGSLPSRGDGGASVCRHAATVRPARGPRATQSLLSNSWVTFPRSSGAGRRGRIQKGGMRPAPRPALAPPPAPPRVIPAARRLLAGSPSPLGRRPRTIPVQLMGCWSSGEAWLAPSPETSGVVAG
jgi:hypothetical protein